MPVFELRPTGLPVSTGFQFKLIRLVYRFSLVFGTNRLDHDLPEVETVQNIYTLGGFY